MRIKIYFLLAAPLIIMQSCSDEKMESKISVTEKKQSSFKLATVQQQQPQFTITLPGELKPFEQVNIYSKVKGFVKKLYVDRGSFVRKGQLLAQLEAPEVGQQYAAIRSSSGTSYQKFLFSKQAYNRLKEAAKKNGAVATIELEKAYAQYLGDSAAYNSSRSQASASGQMQNYLRITAPFSGIITGRFISEGALVGESSVNGEPLFQLSQQSKLRLTVAIPEKQARSLPPDTKAQFTVVDIPDKTFTATLSRNSGALDEASRSLIAEFDLPNTDSELRSGQYAKAKIQLMRSQPTLWVPSASVLQSQAGAFVIKNENGAAKRTPVQTGAVKDSLTEVFGELSAGDRILLKGSEEIKDGTKITGK
ncbi:efflux RND transporter periplasmic adaptor subunit [Flavihumibacter sp. ZG627]|uniref:efflux RND transporter periplasmic adaptor subunit n=1 Tax=Flavihumibacter sp. ZG627 TaxID=1463156 RepID=UPI00057E91A0|nr:efflux RND transporter periplasmic adaptor subunit [Flavihumibacter sp. ZG627]KIC90286.1 hypothetical protein HY58_09935 [Flavihumibacter sp. ZG627]